MYILNFKSKVIFYLKSGYLLQCHEASLSIWARQCGGLCLCAHIWHSFQFHFPCWIKSKLHSNAWHMWVWVWVWGGGKESTSCFSFAGEKSSQLSSIPSAAAGLFLAAFFPSVRPICCNDLLTNCAGNDNLWPSGSGSGWLKACKAERQPARLAGLLPFGRLHSCAQLVSVSGADNICLAPTWSPITFKLANYPQLFDPVALTLIRHSHWNAAHYRAYFF